MANKSGRLRIIGGLLKGRRLDTLPGEAIRPTGDLVREALFDILGNRVSGTAFLDAYAGTGAIGIEAFSRGAREVTFIEHERAASDLIYRNLSSIGVDPARTHVIAREMAQAIAFLVAEVRRFDLIYLDPPYEGGELERGLLAVGQSRLLSDSGIVIGEHDARTRPPTCPVLSAYRTARYGRAALTFYTTIPSTAVR